MSGNKKQTLQALGELRLEMGRRLGLLEDEVYAPVWIVDFPLFEKDEESGELHAVHHPFTSPKKGQLHLIESDPEHIKAEAYDLVINGNEIGGGSIRIFDTELQKKMFRVLGFSDEEAKEQFGFLMEAFKYGAPPHGGIAFGFDRWVALFNGSESIRDVIAFPKNNAGRDIMIDAPSPVDEEQLEELSLALKKKEE
jgi:aspartyl-tRNA synthetase